MQAEGGIQASGLPQLMAIFSAAYLAVSILFVLLFGHALHQRKALELNPVEISLTKVSIGAATLNGMAAVLSLAIALAGGGAWAGLICPILLAPGFTVYYTITGRRRRRFSAVPEL